MIYFLSFLSIIGFIGVLAKRFRIAASILPLFVCTSIAVLLYIFSATPLLFWANKVIFFAGLLSLLYCFAHILLRNNFSPIRIIAFTKTVPSEFWFFLLIGIAWYFFTKGAVLHNADEFFWALYSKFIFLNHGLQGNLGQISDYGITYPPAVILFRYFFQQTNVFSESALYFAQGILLFSALSFIFSVKKIGYKINILLILTLLSFLSYFLFGAWGFLSILTDHIIGIIFGISILISGFSLNSTKSKLILLPILFFLTLIKENGIIFSFIIVAFNIIHLWFFSRKQLKASIASIAIILLIILTPILALGSWRLYLSHLKISSNVSAQSIQQNAQQSAQQTIDQGISQCAQQNAFQSVDPSPEPDNNVNYSYRDQIIKKFNQALVSLPMNSVFEKDSPRAKSFVENKPILSLILRATNIPKFSITLWASIAIILCLIIINGVSQKNKKLLALTFITSILGLTFYLISILCAYLLFYPMRDALELTSMGRYVNTYTLGLFTIIIGAAILTSRVIKKKDIVLLAVAVFLIFVLQIPPLNTLFIYPRNNINKTNILRDGLNPWIQLLKTNVPENETVFIYTKFKDVESPILTFEIFPMKYSSGASMRVENPGEEDIWMPDLDPNKMKELFETGKYHYFLVDRVDESFWNAYGNLFKDIDNSRSYRLFKIENNEAAGPKIVPFAQ